MIFSQVTVKYTIRANILRWVNFLPNFYHPKTLTTRTTQIDEEFIRIDFWNIDIERK